ncbi:tetratricopeptide repeat protein [Roseomonas eburnea]|uniref:Tetratricopeptide repeat protein n=1 Tax=Neoroseomonas eburnea TaxID=1346889 RepID=A0A9X9X666_9PROT|nr:tetratricopeptide repeat protein [Neoroseomonas eburnea]MBR0679202.1 tetratricopeptide repeat protein [Neoroseomonas eburnea]
MAQWPVEFPVTIHPDPAPPPIGEAEAPSTWKSKVKAIIRGIGNAIVWLAGFLARIPTFITASIGAVLLAAVTLLGFWIVKNEIDTTVVLIQPISVPPSLANRGLTSDVLARRLLDEIEGLQRRAPTDLAPRAGGVGRDFPDFSVPGTGMSISGVVELVRHALARPRPRIFGEIVEQEGGSFLRVRMTEGSNRIHNVQINGDDALDEALRRAAVRILMEISPFHVAAAEYSDASRSPDELMRLAREAESRLISRPERWRAINLQGIIYLLKMQDPQAAIREFDRALQYNNESYHVYANRGNAYFSMANYREAESNYIAALDRSEKNFQIVINLAIAYSYMHRYQDAIREIGVAKSINANNHVIFMAEGLIHERRGEFQRAEEAYIQSGRLSQNNLEVALNLANFYADVWVERMFSSRGDFDAFDMARHYYAEAVRINENAVSFVVRNSIHALNRNRGVPVQRSINDANLTDIYNINQGRLMDRRRLVFALEALDRIEEAISHSEILLAYEGDSYARRMDFHLRHARNRNER